MDFERARLTPDGQVEIPMGPNGEMIGSVHLKHAMDGVPPEYHPKVVQMIGNKIAQYLRIKGWKERVETFQKDLDAAIKVDLGQFRRRENSPHKISCQKGCSYCCYMNIAIFKEEARLLASKIKKKKIKFNRKEYEYQVGKGMNTPEDYWNDPRPCIFLDTKTRSCNIYDDRPATCRKYFVVNKPSLCKIEAGSSDKVASPPMINSEILYTAFSHATESVDCGPMPMMIKAELEK